MEIEEKAFIDAHEKIKEANFIEILMDEYGKALRPGVFLLKKENT